MKNVYQEENKEDSKGLPAETTDTYADKWDEVHSSDRSWYSDNQSVQNALQGD